MAEQPGFVVEQSKRRNWPFDVRWTNDMGGFTVPGMAIARCDTLHSADRIANALNTAAERDRLRESNRALVEALEAIERNDWHPSEIKSYARAAIARHKGE